MVGDANAWEIRVGEVIGGRFEVTRLIGRGGMGVVVEARHAHSDAMASSHRVAVKILHQRHLENQEAVARFAQEGRAYASVRGAHIVRILDSGHHEGRPFLVMELLAGQDLESVMEEGPLPLPVAAHYILQACEGMAEVHANGMVHRDLKPSNLFLTSQVHGSPMIKILDFGIAKGIIGDDPALFVQTQTLVAMGTPLYMSPEQIRSSREVDARADIWSLGAIFYELVAGRPAFGGNTVTNITAQVLEANPAPLSSIAGVPREVDAVVAKALAKHPDDRFVDVASFAKALEPFADVTAHGTSARCARVLSGVLRTTGQNQVTTPPVTRDDALGGTIRFDRKRRGRLIRAALAVLAVFSVVLVALAVSAYNAASQGQSQALAQRGLKSFAARASERAIDQRRTVATDTASASSSAAAPPPSSSSAAPAATSSGPAPLRSPWPAPTASTRPTATARPTGSSLFNPFTERN